MTFWSRWKTCQVDIVNFYENSVITGLERRQNSLLAMIRGLENLCDVKNEKFRVGEKLIRMEGERHKICIFFSSPEKLCDGSYGCLQPNPPIPHQLDKKFENQALTKKKKPLTLKRAISSYTPCRHLTASFMKTLRFSND